MPRAQLNVNSARAITWFVGVTIYCTYFNDNSPLPCQFLCNKILLKKISYSKGKLIEQIFESRGLGPPGQKWKPVGLPVGSRFFDRPVKPVEKPVKFSFLATKRQLSTNRNILIYFIINKTFYKKTVLINHIFRKHLLNSFKL